MKAIVTVIGEDRVGIIAALILMTIIIIFSRQIAMLFTTDEEIIRNVTLSFYVVVFSIPMQNGRVILSGALRGAGDTKYTAFVIMITVMIVRPLVAFITITMLDWSLYGAWCALILDQLLRTGLIFLRLNSGKWKTAIKTRTAKAA